MGDQQELAQAREAIDQFFSVSLDGMVLADGDGKFLRVNPAFEHTLGLSAGEIVGRSAIDFLHPDDRAVSLGLSAQRKAGAPLTGVENRFRCSDGSYRWLRWSATSSSNGLVYATARDVTEAREIEAALRSSQEQALEASRLKSEFVSNMSHEIRTPLNGVVCMSELMLDTDLSDEQREYANVGLTSAEALIRVIDDILDFSKIEAGKLDILDEDFSIEAAADDVCEILGIKAGEKSVDLAVSIDPDVPAVLRGDSNRLRQMLINLVDNAIKFTSEGEIVVRMTLQRAERETELLRVEVIDTGIGIEPDRIAELFSPFSQADGTTTRRYGGIGLGLSITKQLAELMGGEIGAKSTPGAGSTFWFTLPCVRGTARPAAPQPSSPSNAEGRRVLVAEDNEINQLAARGVLERFGLSVDIASDGREAIEASARFRYAAVFMDCQMPEVDGYTATGVIRHREGTGRHTPIIAMTAHTMAGDRDKCLAAGMDDYIPKPVRFANVETVLAGLFADSAELRLGLSATLN
jgi:PAS domain S-box-containing protein